MVEEKALLSGSTILNRGSEKALRDNFKNWFVITGIFPTEKNV